MTAVAVPLVSATNNDYVDLDCIKGRVIRCILEAAGEFEIRECIKEYHQTILVSRALKVQHSTFFTVIGVYQHLHNNTAFIHNI